MFFNSWEFVLVFLPVTFLVYFWLNKIRLVLAGKFWLVFANIFFYAYWNVEYLSLLLGSLLINFIIGKRLSNNQISHQSAISRKNLLISGVFINLLLLCYFKYTDFLIENFNHFSGTHLIPPGIVLPLAISFFTFQQIAYLVDSYRGKTEECDLLNYALFVTFFPQLIAGPIVHHKEMMPQFKSRWTLVMCYRNVLKGLYIFGLGLFKKVAIADTFAIWANFGFDGSVDLDLFTAWATSLSYTFQLYFDFSGYCDMAIGAALLFNIKLPLNFNSPYKAINIQDFWRRWHITLSHFLRDYLYVPLGGNRGSSSRICFNVMATFVLGGLWHGAGWMFVIWGALHGTAFIVYRFWRSQGRSLPNFLAWLITFIFVNFAWVFFRAKTVDDAVKVLKGMVDFETVFEIPISSIPTEQLAWGGWLSDYLLYWLPNTLVGNVASSFAILAALVVIQQKNAYEAMLSSLNVRSLAVGATLFSIGLYFTISSTSSEFLYFNF